MRNVTLKLLPIDCHFRLAARSGSLSICPLKPSLDQRKPCGAYSQVQTARGTFCSSKCPFQSDIPADLTSPASLGEAHARSFSSSAGPSLTKDTALESCSNCPDIDFLLALPPPVSMPCLKKLPLSIPAAQHTASNKLSGM